MPRRSLTRLCRLFPILKMQWHPNTRIRRSQVVRRAPFSLILLLYIWLAFFILLSARYTNNKDKDPEDMADHKKV
jgi:hypothetical protein